MRTRSQALGIGRQEPEEPVDDQLANKPEVKPLQEATDYYINEDGLMVFTAQYHLNRGYCCGNGCKHCPYLKKGGKD